MFLRNEIILLILLTCLQPALNHFQSNTFLKSIIGSLTSQLMNDKSVDIMDVLLYIFMNIPNNYFDIEASIKGFHANKGIPSCF